MIDLFHPSYAEFDFQFVPAYLSIVAFNGTLAFIFHIFLIFIILFKTTREMGYYKYYLLNIAIMSFLHDTVLSTLWKPIPILPIIGGYSAGPAKHLGPHWGGHCMLVILVAFIILYLASIISGFFYRLSALLRKKYYDFFISSIGTAVVIAIHVILTLALCIPLYFSSVEISEKVESGIIQKYPQIAPILETENIFIYDLQVNPFFGYFLIGAVVAILFIPPITGGCIYAILRILYNSQTHLQAKTIKLHRQLLVALIIQIILPFLLIIFPIVIVCIFIYFQLPHTSAAIQCAIICCTFHSIADTVVMIFMIAPYRKATIQLLLMCFPKRIQKKIFPSGDGNFTMNPSRRGTTQTQTYYLRSRAASVTIIS